MHADSRSLQVMSGWATLVAWFLAMVSLAADNRSMSLDPAAWGSDHVGQPVPQFVAGDQCLFCHRKDIGPAWPSNTHGLTMRVALGESAAEQALRADESLRDCAQAVTALLGTGSHQRFLKAGERFGQMEVLSVRWSQDADTPDGRLTSTFNPHWDAALFGDACAGCHATGVDSQTRQFQAMSLDCFVCHGDPSDDHTMNAALVRLSPQRATPAVEVMSICGQCHLRGGRSRSTKLPYPNHYVPGDNLFRDFEMDWSDAGMKELDPIDAHIFANIRDVVLEGREELTCLSCHDVHAQTSERHERLQDAEICWQCHQQDRPKHELKVVPEHSTICDYGILSAPPSAGNGNDVR